MYFLVERLSHSLLYFIQPPTLVKFDIYCLLVVVYKQVLASHIFQGWNLFRESFLIWIFFSGRHRLVTYVLQSTVYEFMQTHMTFPAVEEIKKQNIIMKWPKRENKSTITSDEYSTVINIFACQCRGARMRKKMSVARQIMGVTTCISIKSCFNKSTLWLDQGIYMFRVFPAYHSMVVHSERFEYAMCKNM